MRNSKQKKRNVYPSVLFPVSSLMIVFDIKNDQEEKRKSNGHTLLWRYYFGRKRNCLREEVYLEATFSKIRLDIEM